MQTMENINSPQYRGAIKRQEHMWTLSSESMSEPAIKSWMQFLAMASNAHTIDTTLRADSKEYSFQTDFLKYVKWLPVYRNDVTGELEDVANSHLAKTIANNKKSSIELHDLKCSIREALCQIEGNKCDLSQGAGTHEALHNAGVQRDMDIIIKCCGEFL